MTSSNHIFPKTYFAKMLQVAPNHQDMGKRVREIPVLVDLEQRFRVMDRFADYAQVICLASPPLEALAGPEVTPELAQVANDGMAEYVAKYPERFPGFIASLPLNNLGAYRHIQGYLRGCLKLSLREAERQSNLKRPAVNSKIASLLTVAAQKLPMFLLCWSTAPRYGVLAMTPQDFLNTLSEKKGKTQA